MTKNAIKEATAKQGTTQHMPMDRGVTKLSIGQSRIRITYAAEKNTTAVQAVRSILLNAAPF